MPSDTESDRKIRTIDDFYNTLRIPESAVPGRLSSNAAKNQAISNMKVSQIITLCQEECNSAEPEPKEK